MTSSARSTSTQRRRTRSRTRSKTRCGWSLINWRKFSSPSGADRARGIGAVLRTLLAPNPSPMTLQGTQTYIVGRERCAIIDPGPDLDEHVDAVARAVSGGVAVSILITHAHPDHDAGAARLAARLEAPIVSGERGLKDGDVIAT